MKTKSLGFTLLESMAALIVLSMSLFATYSWMSVSIQTLQRSDQVLTEELLVNEFVERLVSGSIEFDGMLNRGDVSLSWRNVSIEKASGRNNLGNRGYYDHELLELEVEIRVNGKASANHLTRIAVSDRVREPAEAIFQ